jgi:hypothetical protein
MFFSWASVKVDCFRNFNNAFFLSPEVLPELLGFAFGFAQHDSAMLNNRQQDWGSCRSSMLGIVPDAGIESGIKLFDLLFGPLLPLQVLGTLQGTPQILLTFVPGPRLTIEGHHGAERAIERSYAPCELSYGFGHGSVFIPFDGSQHNRFAPCQP